MQLRLIVAAYEVPPRRLERPLVHPGAATGLLRFQRPFRFAESSILLEDRTTTIKLVRLDRRLHRQSELAAKHKKWKEAALETLGTSTIFCYSIGATYQSQ